MKLFRLLTVPAVLLFTIMMAVPASAHHITEVVLSQTCDKDTGKVCVQLTGSVQPATDERIVTLRLLGQKGSDTPVKVGDVTIKVPQNHGQTATSFDSGVICFAASFGTFDTFSIQWVQVTDAAGKPADLSIKLKTGETFTQGNLPATLVTGIKPCTTPAPTPTPTPTASASPSASASPTAKAVAALAQTGGFDFRFPLVGLAVLVVGLTLLLVSAGRGRRSSGER